MNTGNGNTTVRFLSFLFPDILFQLSSFVYDVAMETWEITEEVEARQTALGETGYTSYCLRTKTGWECSLARHLNRLNGELLALPFMKLSHKSRGGVKSVEQKTVLPSYVFLYTPRDFNVGNISRTFREGFQFMTNVDSSDTVLKGSDLLYARWVFSSSGIIGMSRAIRVNGKVRIISGPLVALEGHIKEYSKKNRNCRVETVLFNRIISVWLPFEYVEEIPEETQQAVTPEVSDTFRHKNPERTQ